MGSCQTKDKSNYPRKKDVEALRAKVKLQKEEIKEIMCMRENENEVYEQEMTIFALKELEWKRERKKLREEVKKFKNKLEEREDISSCSIRGLVKDDDDDLAKGEEKSSENEWHMLGNAYLMERMREERELRDQAIDKWKSLYLAIKKELDHMIKMTNQGERACWISEEEDLVDKLHKEVEAKEVTIQFLMVQLASMEKERCRMEREVDILRQSLRIMSHKKKG